MKKTQAITKDLSDALYLLGRVGEKLGRKGAIMLGPAALTRCVNLVRQSRFDLEHVRRILYGDVKMPEGQADDGNGNPEPDSGGGP